jgi:hypothetical protein
MKLFFLGHLGLGDHFVYAGMMRWLSAANTEELKIVCKHVNLPTLKHLYSDDPKITFYPISDDNEISPHYGAPKSTIESIAAAGYTIIAVGTHGARAHTYLQLDPCWANTFYKEIGVDPSTRFSHWRTPYPLTAAEQKWRRLLGALYGQDYVVVHDDPSRNFVIDYVYVHHRLRVNGMEHLPIVYLGKDRYKEELITGLNNPTHIASILECDSLLDLTLVMRHAVAAHMMDSSPAILLDLTLKPDDPLTAKQERVSYMKYDMLPTSTGLYQNKWTYYSPRTNPYSEEI